uniref:ATP synthase subunit b', chloroplastic n=2 Tax=Eukaryota TaxID=2759 RepID=A0A7S1T276_9CHLO
MASLCSARSAVALRPASRTTVRAARPAARVVAVRAQQQQQQKLSVVDTAVSAMKPATVAAVANIFMALPASADAGKLFDFNLTLPVMAAEFLLLMVFLDKTWFTPVGDLLDKRDAELRGMVGEVKDNSANLAALKAEADGILRSARADAQAQLQACKSECQADMDSKFGAAKAKVDKELQVALEALAKEEAEALKSMQGQVDSLSNEIIARVLPEGVSL